MLNKNISITYPLLLILSTGKRSFESLGRLIDKSGKTIKRLMPNQKECLNILNYLAGQLFHKKKKLYLIIDDTLIRKIYSRFMTGSGWFYDTKIGRCIMAYRLIVVIITDGKIALPLNGAFLFAKELLLATDLVQSKEDLAKSFILTAIKTFPNAKIIVTADGFYSTVSFITWCIANNVAAEMRMHSNRKIQYKSQSLRLDTIAGLKPKGRHMARTILVTWHDLRIWVTAHRRINKHGEESIVYLVATYEARPSQHVATYKIRWLIEKAFRTMKQHLGLQECYSLELETQENHIISALLAYAFVQIVQKQKRLRTPEDAIRWLKQKKVDVAQRLISPLVQIFEEAHA